METRRIKMRECGRQPQTPGRRRGNEAVEFRHTTVVKHIQRTTERVIMKMVSLNAGGDKARDRLILEKMGDEVELLVEKAQTVEHHGFDRMASGHNPHFGVLLRRLINDLSNAKFFKHPRNQPQVIQDLRTVRLRLLYRHRKITQLDMSGAECRR